MSTCRLSSDRAPSSIARCLHAFDCQHYYRATARITGIVTTVIIVAPPCQHRLHAHAGAARYDTRRALRRPDAPLRRPTASWSRPAPHRPQPAIPSGILSGVIHARSRRCLIPCAFRHRLHPLHLRCPRPNHVRIALTILGTVVTALARCDERAHGNSGSYKQRRR